MHFRFLDRNSSDDAMLQMGSVAAAARCMSAAGPAASHLLGGTNTSVDLPKAETSFGLSTEALCCAMPGERCGAKWQVRRQKLFLSNGNSGFFQAEGREAQSQSGERHSMGEEKGNSSLFAVFVLSLLTLALIPWTIYKTCGSGGSEQVAQPWLVSLLGAPGVMRCHHNSESSAEAAMLPTGCNSTATKWCI